MANDTYGAIKLSDANAVGSMLVKKMGGVGYAPKEWADVINLMGKLPEKTASGSIANFSDGANDVPIKSWKATISPTLSGVSAVHGTKSGKNLFDKTNTSGIVTGYIATSNFNDGNTRAKTVYIEIKGGATYTVSKTAGQRFQIATAEVPPTNGAVYTGRQTGNTASSLTITAGANDKYLWAWIFLEGTDTGTLSDMLDSVQIEVGSSASSYTAYTATTQYTASLGRTIYGGTADVVNGTGTITEKQVKFSDLAWTYQSSYNRFRAQDLTAVIAKPATNQTVLAGLLSSAYTAGVANSSYATDLSIAVNVSGEIFVYDSNYTDKDVWLAQFGNDTISYPLATPEDFTFTPITPTPHTALGTNNLWNDCGDSEVTYRRDIDLALNSGSYLLGFGLGNPNVGQESEE